jgi:FtsH-binding integral membrane protein
MQEADKKQARELLIQAKVYRALTVVFACLGAGIFAALFFQHHNGDLMASLQDPMTVVFIIFPFVPALWLSRKSRKAEKALSKLLTPES